MLKSADHVTASRSRKVSSRWPEGRPTIPCH